MTRVSIRRCPQIVAAGLLCGFLILDGRESAAQVSRVEHVVLLGIDGLSPEGVRLAATPVLDALIADGASSMRAVAVLPTSSSANWMSMLAGVVPRRHGVTSNNWRPTSRKRSRTGAEGAWAFPTIVAQLRRERPDSVIGVFHEWDGFGRLIEFEAATGVEDTEGPEAAVAAARKFFARRPLLTIVQLDHVDAAGHGSGWLSPDYLAAVERADRLAGDLIAGLREAGLWDRTAIIVSSDHGGVKRGHGGSKRAEVEIPWVAAGAGIAKGREIRQRVETIDTAPTIAHLVGARLHSAWVGRPVWDALAER
ncbi:MAG: alkaline phosphatase [Vicinamibacterales bacterium]